jgi:hypothetical protein
MTMTYKELQTALKTFRNEGLTQIKLNSTKDLLQAEYDRLTETTPPKVKSLIVCDREAISDVVYAELVAAFNLKDDECLPAWGGFYRYEKPKKSLTEPNIYFVLYEHVNGRSGGNYQVKVTFDEPSTTVIEPEVNPTTDNEIETDTSEIVITETLTITFHSFKEILKQRKSSFRPKKAHGFKIVKEKRYDQLSLTEWLGDTLAFLDDDVIIWECDYIAA